MVDRREEGGLGHVSLERDLQAAENFTKKLVERRMQHRRQTPEEMTSA